MVTSFRSWLILSFGVILLICLVAIGLFVTSLNKSKKLEDYHSNLKTTRILLLEINKLKEDILAENAPGNGFYTDSFSEPERRLHDLKIKTRSYIQYLLKSKITSDNKLEWKTTQVAQEFSQYNKTYEELVYLYKLKGFKDYGLEGKMREYAHKLFNEGDRYTQFVCLVLRKHEKDFLLRKDLNYVHQFNIQVRFLYEYINEHKHLNEELKRKLVNSLYFYHKHFKMLARIDSKIGTNSKGGFLFSSKKNFDRIASLIEDLDNELILIKQEHKEKLANDSVIVLIVLVIFLLSAIIALTQLISKSVKNISNSFTKYVNSGFNIDSVSFKRSGIREFNAINVSFLRMAKEINIFANFFREKVHERTLEINQQKDEILVQQAQIEAQYKTLLTKNMELGKQRKMLASKNQDIQESLRYAKRIQKALQPGSIKFKECFGDSFIYSKAKDVVSGDFHLAYKLNGEQGFTENKTVFVASDCTGHGVPGAIMSVLGINILHKIVRELKNSDPGTILNLLDKDIDQVLAQGKNSNDIIADGMDIGVFCFNNETYELNYSIAKFSHFLVRDSEIMQLDTLKSTIGYSFFENHRKCFKTSSIQLKKGDCLYLFSDGLQDQFGGPENKKFKKNNIRELIREVHRSPMKAQKEVFKTAFKEWKGRLEQTDDVLVMGIRF
ncbi:MAG: SpoIIE family protein phosphatase [Bacteroidia bacterium]|nr:SpoIIE family protein phosphatase [Bacteroidia bacterium]